MIKPLFSFTLNQARRASGFGLQFSTGQEGPLSSMAA